MQFRLPSPPVEQSNRFGRIALRIDERRYDHQRPRAKAFLNDVNANLSPRHLVGQFGVLLRRHPLRPRWFAPGNQVVVVASPLAPAKVRMAGLLRGGPRPAASGV